MTKLINNKRSIATYSSSEKSWYQKNVAAGATSSKAAAEKFLKKAGIPDKQGEVSVHYKNRAE